MQYLTLIRIEPLSEEEKEKELKPRIRFRVMVKAVVEGKEYKGQIHMETDAEAEMP